MYYSDGRNYLLTQNKRYDLISMELTSIWFAGAANLYNREFYQLAKARAKRRWCVAAMGATAPYALA